jgi:hypothetical protein
MSFLAEIFWVESSWAEWFIGPKNANWLKNILKTYQYFMTVFSKNVDFKHKLECEGIASNFRIVFSHINKHPHRIYPLF